MPVFKWKQGLLVVVLCVTPGRHLSYPGPPRVLQPQREAPWRGFSCPRGSAWSQSVDGRRVGGRPRVFLGETGLGEARVLGGQWGQSTKSPECQDGGLGLPLQHLRCGPGDHESLWPPEPSAAQHGALVLLGSRDPPALAS
jgi:hypothetical protein